MDAEDAATARDDAMELVDAIEKQTSDRLNGQWEAKFRLQAPVHKFMLNTQQALTNQLAGMLNGMKSKVNLQCAFLGALTEGKTKAAHVAEVKKTGATPQPSRPGSAADKPSASSPSSRPASAGGRPVPCDA